MILYVAVKLGAGYCSGYFGFMTADCFEVKLHVLYRIKVVIGICKFAKFMYFAFY